MVGAITEYSELKLPLYFFRFHRYGIFKFFYPCDKQGYCNGVLDFFSRKKFKATISRESVKRVLTGEVNEVGACLTWAFCACYSFL